MNNIFAKITILALFFIGVAFLVARGTDMPWDMQEDIDAGQQEEAEDEEAAQQEMDSSVYGKLISVNVPGKTIVVEKEDAYSNKVIGGDSPTIYTISVSQETTFVTADSLDDLNVGDNVQVDYYTFKDRRIAEHIILESSGSEKSPDTSDELLPTMVSK